MLSIWSRTSTESTLFNNSIVFDANKMKIMAASTMKISSMSRQPNRNARNTIFTFRENFSTSQKMESKRCMISRIFSFIAYVICTESTNDVNMGRKVRNGSIFLAARLCPAAKSAMFGVTDISGFSSFDNLKIPCIQSLYVLARPC